MTTQNSPNHFDPRNIFLSTKWNVFVLVAKTLFLLAVIEPFANTLRTAGWWPDVGWALGFLALICSIWTSATRLRRAHKSAAPTR